MPLRGIIEQKLDATVEERGVPFCMERVRIGCVKYLNTLPLIEGLAAWRDAELVSAVPSRLIDMLLGREVDVALCSVIDAARNRGGPAGGGVLPLAVGMIGCDGPTLTVRVFSRVPLEDVRTIGADTDSHTSVALMRVVMKRRHGTDVRVLDFDAREHVVIGAGSDGAMGGARPDALLLIGDKVETDPPDAHEYPHQLDLGEAWKELTGLPFVYAVWMCREGEEESVPVRMAASALDRSRRHNAMRMDWLAASRAGERGWPADAAAEYLGHKLKYEVGEREAEAVARFVEECAGLGLCEGGELKWVEV